MASNPTDADDQQTNRAHGADNDTVETRAREAGGDGGAPAEGVAASPEARVVALEAQNRELHDRMLRVAAEFENWKKRSRREQEEASTRGREALLKELLPALDNLERALKAAAESDPVAVGVRLVDKQLMSALEKFEVKRFSAVGQPFDPNVHEAIQQVESKEHAPGTVAQEFAHGYMIGTRLLRPAMVAVAKAPPAEVAKAPTGGGEG